MPDMYDDIQDWDYELPEELIATIPAERRLDSRLMHVDVTADSIEHPGTFAAILDLLRPEDLLVFNDARVVSARLAATKTTGGKVEIFALDVLNPDGREGWDERIRDVFEIEAMTRSSKALRPGQRLTVSEELAFEVLEWEHGLARLRATRFPPVLTAFEIFERFGEIPLPPYIVKERAARNETFDGDAQRYQTVFASKPGAVAAPTAGLHFSEGILEAIRELGVTTEFVTLDVGAGTFRPVTSDLLSDHTMHHEWYTVGPSFKAALDETRRRGGRVIAVGTTVVRVLESEARRSSKFEAGRRSTDLFLRPGSSFEEVDAVVTNFHLPRSTLLALVAAFAGYDLMHRAYAEAIERGYRFYSYGDAMFISRTSP